jgi:tetratricopeptide (TPR) repeat protein
MKSLTIHHLPGLDGTPPRTRVSYRQAPHAQAQEHETEFHFTVTNEERGLIQWYLEDYLQDPWGVYPERAQKAETLMERLGQELFEAVFSNRETQALYAHVGDDLPNTRITIHAVDPEGIALPWELMRDPARAEYGDLARLAHVFVRSQPNLVTIPPTVKKKQTFNILLVISRPGGPGNDIPFQSTARPLVELFRQHGDRIHLDVLRPPTFEQLAKVLREKPNFYHVLHFDGHGVFPDDSQGVLLFEGENGQGRLVTGQELGKVLAAYRVPIVLLDACQSGMTSPESIYASVGNQLLKAGACGVVAMAYSVYVSTSARFMRTLYEGLVNGEELGRAVMLARHELCAHPQRQSPIGEIDLQDWIVPISFEAAPVQVMPRQTGKRRVVLSLPKKSSDKECAEADNIWREPLYGFVGRDDVIHELERAFRTQTTILLTGMAGVGKTEAVKGFVRWLSETGGLDGPAFFFSFEHYLPLAQVCDRIGRAFNQLIRKELSTDWDLLEAEDRPEVVLSILQQIRCLMIWDNFEPVHDLVDDTESTWTAAEQQELRAFLEQLQGHKTKVLITSRTEEKWLGKIPRRLEIGGLSLFESQQLAVHVLERAGLRPEQIRKLPQYNGLLNYLQGNPLAIQIVLPDLAHTSPEDLLEKLRSGSGTFKGEDKKQGREHSLTASLTYRFNSFDPTQRKRLAVLAPFQGFVDADVLTFMCDDNDCPDFLQGLTKENWLELLDMAALCGLLRPLGGGMYTVHPALPWFFRREQAEAMPDHEWLETAYVRACASYGSYLDDLFKTNAGFAMFLLRMEESNILHALALARKSDSWENVQDVLYGIRQLYVTQGRWVEWERLVADVEQEITDKTGDPLPGREDLFTVVLGHRAELLHYRRDWHGAQTIYLRLKRYCEEIEDHRNMAVALHQLGMIAEERHNYDEAEKCYKKSLEIKERIGDEHGQASTLHQLGMIAEERHNYDEAEECYKKSLEIEERIGDEHGQAQTFHQLGMIAQERHDYDEAEEWYEKSLEIKERIGNEHGQASTLHQLGMIAQERHDYDEAEEWYKKSLEIEERIGDEHGQASTLNQLGMIAEERHNYDEAEKWCKKSLEIKERIGNEHGQAFTLHQLGIIAQERHNYDEAEEWYKKSLEIKERIGNEHGQASTLHQLGRIAEERGNTALAIDLYERAEAIFIAFKDEHSLAIVRKSLERVRG